MGVKKDWEGRNKLIEKLDCTRDGEKMKLIQYYIKVTPRKSSAESERQDTSLYIFNWKDAPRTFDGNQFIYLKYGCHK